MLDGQIRKAGDDQMHHRDIPAFTELVKEIKSLFCQSWQNLVTYETWPFTLHNILHFMSGRSSLSEEAAGKVMLSRYYAHLFQPKKEQFNDILLGCEQLLMRFESQQ